jgi:hypothetical protein
MPLNYVTSGVQTFTRPNDTTAYAAGDLVANDTTAGSVTALTWTIPGGSKNIAKIVSVIMSKSDGADVTNATFRVHFYNVTPLAPANGDNGALAPVVTAMAASAYLGHSGTITHLLGGDSAGHANPAIPLTGLTSDTVYGLIEATAAYQALALETFSVQFVAEITY